MLGVSRAVHGAHDGIFLLLFAIRFYSLWSVSLVTEQNVFALRRRLQRWKFYNSFQVGERDCLSYTSSVSALIRALGFRWCQKRTKWACGAHTVPWGPSLPGAQSGEMPFCHVTVMYPGAKCVNRGPLTWTIVHNHTQYASNYFNKNTKTHNLHNFHISSNMGVY